MLGGVLHHQVYFHIRDTFLLFCDFDCHASFGRGHSSVLTTHAATKCETEIVLIAAGNSPLVWRDQKGDFCRFVPGGSAITRVHQKLWSKVSKLNSHSSATRLIGSRWSDQVKLWFGSEQELGWEINLCLSMTPSQRFLHHFSLCCSDCEGTIKYAQVCPALKKKIMFHYFHL